MLIDAIVCEKPNQFAKTKVNLPAINEEEVLIKIRRVGICGTDLHAYKGNQPYFEYPRILGHELAGEVAEVGHSVKHVKKGDHAAIVPYLECGECIACRKGRTNACESLKVLGVHIDGGMQEYLAVPQTHVIPTNHISLDSTAVTECLSIGAHAVKRSHFNKDEYVLIIGAGPIGLGVMKFAKLNGGKVIAMDMNKHRLRFSQEWAGADFIVHASESPKEKIAEITGGDMPTTIFDATGNAKSMEYTFDLASHGGEIVYVSLVKDTITFSDPDFHKKEITLLSSRNATVKDFEYVIHHMEQGNIDVRPFITHRTSLSEMPGDFDSFYDPDTVVKAMVEL